jgi:hypothetical protein
MTVFEALKTLISRSDEDHHLFGLFIIDVMNSGVLRSLLGIPRNRNSEQVPSFFQQSARCFIPISIAVGPRKILALQRKCIFKSISGSVDYSTLRGRMDLESIPLYLRKRHLGAVAIHTEITSVLGQGIIG